MKKIYLLVVLTFSGISFGQQLYYENFGTPTGTTLYPAYTTGTAPATFNNASPILYSGSGDVRATSTSTGYVGASAGGNVFLTTAAGRNLLIEGINTSSVVSANLVLSFGYLTNSTAATLTVEQSSDGTTFTPITFTNNTSTTAWSLVTIPGGTLLSTTNLRLRFTQPSTAQMRIDDVRIVNFNPSCALVLSADTSACDASTLALDTYTVTIPFTGGGTATYTIVPSSGTVAGNNPSTAATGNILITGVTEGTNLTVTITGGTCSFSRTITAPECKPVNTLPSVEQFNYTAIGSAVSAEQRWSKLNTGDDINVATGNLTYTGITSAGNSIAFVGAGAEARTPFTSTNSGTIYASFLSKTVSITNVTTDLANTYFAYLGADNAGGTTNARLWIRKNGTQFQYGLGVAAAPTVWSTALFNVDDTQYVVLGYDFANNYLSLTVNPTIGGTTSPTLAVNLTTPLTTLGSFVLRQDSDTTTPSLVIDELKISTTPEFTLKQSSIAEIDGLNIYPNPVSGNILNIETTTNATKVVSIFDVLGKQVLNVTTVNTTVNVGHLNAGVYIVKITEDGKTATRKLVVR